MTGSDALDVLAFTNQFPSPDDPTRGLFNLRRFEALAELCAVRVIVPVPIWRRINRPGEWLRPPQARYNQLLATYPTYWTIPRVALAIHSSAVYRSVRRHVAAVRRTFPFDVMLGAFAYPDVVVTERLARDFKCPFAALVMGSDINDLAQRPLLREQIRLALDRACAVFAVSSALGQKVIELGVPANRVIVQRNGVDGAQFQPGDRRVARQKLGVPPDDPLIGLVGNLVHEKGADVFIEAVGTLAATRGNAVRVVVIGEGALRQHMETRAAALGVVDRIRFVGRRPAHEMPTWMTAFDVLCLPSRREGCPNVVLEALACGRPVVASAVGGVPELVNDRNGILVPAEDPSALARGLAAALTRPWNPTELRSSVESLTWTDFGRAVYRVLDSAVARSCTRP